MNIEISDPTSERSSRGRHRQRTLPVALLRAREAVISRFRPVLMLRTLTEQQWRALDVLYEDGPMDASELADRACILPPSLTRIAKALEERGLIVRERDASDGRRVTLAATQAGTALICEVMPTAIEIYESIVQRYGRERIDQLVDMLVELAEMEQDETP